MQPACVRRGTVKRQARRPHPSHGTGSTMLGSLGLHLSFPLVPCALFTPFSPFPPFMPF